MNPADPVERMEGDGGVPGTGAEAEREFMI
jgi:hypothetical protein